MCDICTHQQLKDTEFRMLASTETVTGSLLLRITPSTHTVLTLRGIVMGIFWCMIAVGGGAGAAAAVSSRLLCGLKSQAKSLIE